MSRRDQIAMTADEIGAYLAGQLTIIVISNGHHGFPHPMPMHFCVYDDGAIGMTTYKKSQKVHNLRRDPRASLLVESGEDYAELRSVLIYADTEIIDDTEATIACMAACREHSNGARSIRSDADTDAEFLRTAAERAKKRLVLKFHPESIVSWDHAKLGGRY